MQVSSPPSEPITLEWMKGRLSNIKDDLVANQTQKSQVDKCIAESKVNMGDFHSKFYSKRASLWGRGQC